MTKELSHRVRYEAVPPLAASDQELNLSVRPCTAPFPAVTSSDRGKTSGSQQLLGQDTHKRSLPILRTSCSFLCTFIIQLLVKHD